MQIIKRVVNQEELLKCFEVMQELRPNLNTENYVEILNGFMQRGYHLIYIEIDDTVVAACGYRFAEHLHWGKVIYIDDLITLQEARKNGYAKLLLNNVIQIAKENNCAQVHLDSGCNAERNDAHRLYLNSGFNITSFHFAKKIM